MVSLDDMVWQRLRPLLDHANQTELAHRLGISQQRLSRYKLGLRKHPPLDVLDGLANAFGLTLADILEDSADDRPTWQRRLYAEIASVDEGTALALIRLLRKST